MNQPNRMRLVGSVLGVVAAGLIALLVSGSSKVAPAAFVGVWKVATPVDTMVLALRSEGSFALNYVNGSKSFDLYGKWSVGESAKLTLNALGEDGPRQFEIISVGKEELDLRPEAGGPDILSLKRISDTPMEPTEAEKIAGTPGGQQRLKEQAIRLMNARIDRAVLNNARQLSAAADQYFLENGVSTVVSTDLIGATNYVKAVNTVAAETYPANFTQGVTITIDGIAGVRTVTYMP